MVELNQTDLAEALGVSTTTVGTWTRQGKLTPRKEGRQTLYGLRQAIVFAVEKGIEEAREAWRSDERETLQDRKLAIEVEKAEFEIAKTRGTVIDAEEAKEGYRRLVTRVRKDLEKIPARFGADLLPDDPSRGKAILDRAIREALNAMAEGTIDEKKNGQKKKRRKKAER